MASGFFLHHQTLFVVTLFILLSTCRQAEVLKADMTGKELSLLL